MIFTQDLRVEDLAKPVPARGEVLVRVETSGLCHTDIHAAHGDWPVKPKLPLIPGHEGVGIVEELGAGVERLKIGERGGHALAGVRLRRLRVLHRRVGDAVQGSLDLLLVSRTFRRR